MTEEKFTELVSLYLDKEIAEEELELLKTELARDPSREKLFEERVRLEKAMRMAFGCPLEDEILLLSSKSKSPRGKIVRFPRWVFSSGLAATFLVAALVIPQISDQSAMGPENSVSAKSDPLDLVGKAAYQRYASAKGNTRHPHASLASHMRLLGLRPEHTPQQKELQPVQYSDYQPITESRNRAEFLRELQNLRAFPETRLIYEDTTLGQSQSPFANGFSASLVRY